MDAKTLISYKEAVRECGSDYRLKRRIASGSLFRLERGLYSVRSSCGEYERMMHSHPHAVYTGESAFYFYGLTDVIPDKHVLATLRSATRVSDPMVKQVFASEKIFSIGRTLYSYNGTMLRIYDKERMLIELLRNKGKFSYDYYKEVIANFRREIRRMDVGKVYDYMNSFSHSDAYIERLELEVL